MQKNFFALLHICAGPVLAAYSLQDEYNATNFFDNFDFFTVSFLSISHFLLTACTDDATLI